MGIDAFGIMCLPINLNQQQARHRGCLQCSKPPPTLAPCTPLQRNVLQALVADMRLNRSLDLASKQAMLNWADEEGRTALMWAAQKNHLHVAQLVGWASTLPAAALHQSRSVAHVCGWLARANLYAGTLCRLQAWPRWCYDAGA